MKEKLKVAIIGAGMIVNAAHLPAYKNLSDFIDVVGICDINPASAQNTAKSFHIPAVYDNAEAMLRQEKPDLVSVCVSNAMHAQMIKLALAHDAHVICEKPLALNYAETVELFDLARRRQLTLVACQTNRFKPENLAAKEIADDGILGDVYFSEITRVRRRGVPTWGSFHLKSANGGGALCDLGVHIIDSTLWIMGNPRPKSVVGYSTNRLTRNSTPLHSSLVEAGAPLGVFHSGTGYTPDQFETEEFAAGTIRFENGSLMNFKIAWAINLPNEVSCKIVGDKAGILLPDCSVISSVGRYQADIAPRIFDEGPYSGQSFNGHWYLIENVVRHILFKDELIVKPEETINVTAIIDAFYRSTDLQREVLLDELPVAAEG